MSARSKAPEWYFLKGRARTGQQAGPFSLEQLGSLAEAGTLEPTDLVWNPQLSQWQLAAHSPGLFSAAASPGAPVGASAPPPPTASGPTRSRSWLPWLAPLLALIIVGAGLGVFFGFFRDNDEQTAGDQTTTSLGVTTTAGVTTTTEALPAWTELTPPGDVPPPRGASPMVYVAGSTRVFLFGGVQVDSGLNDTWQYNPAIDFWTNVNPAGEVPSARAGHFMAAYGVDRLEVPDVILLFGGLQPDQTLLNDTWSYEPATSTWTELSPDGEVPSARAVGSMVYDRGTGKVVLFGGVQADGSFLDDTWTYDCISGDWSQLSIAGEVPSARVNHSMVYDSGAGRVVLFGGAQADDTVLNDTWAFDSAASTWTKLSPPGEIPPARAAQAMAYDSDTGKVVLFGGRRADKTALDDTWVYDSVANTWTELHLVGDLPRVRASHSMVYDSNTGKIVLFGGGAAGEYFNDTWALEL
jgi:N-acetylneuraminic acid mutarotase